MTEPPAALPTSPSFWRAIGIVFETVFRNLRTCLILSVIYALLTGVANAVLQSVPFVVDPARIEPREILAVGVAVVGAFGTIALVFIFVYPATVGSLSLVGSAAVYGDDVDTGGIVRRTLDRAIDAVGTFLLTLLMLAVVPIVLGLAAFALAVTYAPAAGFTILIFGLALYAIPATWFAFRLSLAVPVVMREGLGVVAALRRSWDLVRGAWWWVFGVAIVLSVLGSLASSAFGFVTVIGPGGVVDFVLGAVASALGAAVSVVLMGVGLGVVYAARALPGESSGSMLEHPLPPTEVEDIAPERVDLGPVEPQEPTTEQTPPEEPADAEPVPDEQAPAEPVPDEQSHAEPVPDERAPTEPEDERPPPSTPA